MLAKFRRGEPVDLPDDHPWLERVRQQCGVGKLMRRVRVVTHPLTDYLRMELFHYASEGRFTGTTTEQGSLTRYLNIRDRALADSMELSAYTARATRR